MREPVLIKSLPSDGISIIKVDTFWGDIRVLGQDSSEIIVEVYSRLFGWRFWAAPEMMTEELEKYNLTVEKQGETLSIGAARKNKVTNWLSFLGISFKIYVPNNIYFETNIHAKGGKIELNNLVGKHYFKTSAGEVELTNVRGEVRGKTAAGTIEIKDCKAKIDVSTSAGTIEIYKSEGEISVSTAAGTIELYDLVGNIYATTYAGTIETNRISGMLKVATYAGTVEIRAMNGSVGAVTDAGTIEAEILSFGDFIGLESKAGNIYLRMPNTEGVNLDISANRIKPKQFQNFEGHQSKSSVYGALNGGGIPVELKAHAGNVYIHSTKGSTFQSFSRTFKEAQFNLPPHFFARNIKGFLVSLAVCILMVYGFNSILYFTLELLNPKDPLAWLYKGLLIMNVTDGIATMVCVYVFVQLYEHKIAHNWLKYVVLLGITFIGTFCSQFVSGILYWRHIVRQAQPEGYDSNNSNWIFSIIPSVVACIYFYFWQRSKQITRKISEQEFQLLSLEKLKTKAELDALQARINPHFLYNALNSIAGLVHEDPDKAEKMTLLLSKLFRYTTGTKDQHFNTVEDELAIVKTYLDIEQVRFGDRLTYSVDVEKGVENGLIPRFLLQPIVENAIKHGISKIAEQGRIELRIEKKNSQLILKVHDNGAPFSDNFFTGYGLQSIQDKLKLLYGNKASFDIENNDYKQIIISIPC